MCEPVRLAQLWAREKLSSSSRIMYHATHQSAAGCRAPCVKTCEFSVRENILDWFGWSGTPEYVYHSFSISHFMSIPCLRYGRLTLWRSWKTFDLQNRRGSKCRTRTDTTAVSYKRSKHGFEQGATLPVACDTPACLGPDIAHCAVPGCVRHWFFVTFGASPLPCPLPHLDDPPR